MPIVNTPRGIDLYYETFGDSRNPAIILIAGLGSQSISWAEGFCRRLADGGRFVIRFDNRDSGLSSILDDAPFDQDALRAAFMAGDMDQVRALAPYTVADMAGDVAHLLDGLGVERAHIVGASMGGMIAQWVAILHPDRCHTLTSIMSSTGEPEYGQATPEAREALMAPPATSRDDYIASSANWAVWQSPRYLDLEQLRRDAAAAYDRSFQPAGTSRQMTAIAASPSRVDGLRNLTVPTLVLHGREDTLINYSGGERTAELIPGSRLVLIDDMGHDRPEPLWPAICGEILAHTELGNN